ncbi:MAG: hypothetical protein KKB38_20375 [Gammaproteobacteria bacterium]|nr:hypothetical protein [Gammaproteobacteria bacterium]
MGISDRINDWVEDRRRAWGEALGNFLLGTISRGINSTIDEIQPGASLGVESILHQIRDDPDTPENIRDLINKLTAPGHPLPLLVVIPLALILFIPTLTSIVQPLGRVLNYKQERLFNTYRFDPGVVVNLIRRFTDKYPWIRDDLEDLGFDDKHMEALMDATLFYPQAQDLVTWLAREVFEPDAREKYGLDDEADLIDFSLFEKAGISDDQALNYWRAHWQHPSFMQMRELLIRGLLTRSGDIPADPMTPEEWAQRDQEGIKEVYEWYRLVEVPPHWRDMLTESLFNVPTRVDVRRFWDMRVISEQELYSIYHRQGYKGKDLENYVLWTKVYTDFPLLMARWTNGWITEEDVRQRLIQLGMPADLVQEMIQEKVKVQEAARVEEGKALTKSEIYKGVKQGFLTREEGVELLMDLNYGRAEAEYLVDINVGVLEGSPETFEEFKDLTTKWRRAVGQEAVPLPEELKLAAAEVVELTSQVEALEKEIQELRDKIIPGDELENEATERLEELEVKRNRALASREEAHSRYNGLRAEYEQSLPE